MDCLQADLSVTALKGRSPRVRKPKVFERALREKSMVPKRAETNGLLAGGFVCDSFERAKPASEKNRRFFERALRERSIVPKQAMPNGLLTGMAQCAKKRDTHECG